MLSSLRSKPTPRARFRPALELLESRTLPSTVTVINVNNTGTGSLRAALADTTADTIEFDPSLAGQTIVLTSGVLVVNHNVSINGNGVPLTVSGNNASTVFNVQSGKVASLTGLTITGGTTAPTASNATGGGILDAGRLTLIACTVTGNTAIAVGSNSAYGGGIYVSNGGSLDLESCVVSGNRISSPGDAGGGGGGLYDAGGSGTVTLADSFILQNVASGQFTQGGGISATGSLSLSNCILSGNSSTDPTASSTRLNYAGGLYGTSGTVTLTGCTVTGNSVSGGSGGGGGLYASTLVLTDCSVTSNTVTTEGSGAASTVYAYGGGMMGGTMTLTRVTVAGNAIASTADAGGHNPATAQGGGLRATTLLTLVDCTVAGNTASATSAGTVKDTSSGGGIYFSKTTATAVSITNCTVSGNTAVSNNAGTGGGDALGGGLYVSVVSYTLTLTNCTVANNSATGSGTGVGNGGGLYTVSTAAGGTVALTNCTVAANAAGSAGGGLFNTATNGATVKPLNTIVAGNSAGTLATDASGRFVSQGTNLVGATDGSTGWIDSDQTGSNASPLDARLSFLNNNGGLTLTIALLADSPAIAAGTAAGTPIADQLGQARGDTPSIGAVEYVANTVAGFVIVAPASVTAGTAFTVTVMAVDAFGNVVDNYAGTVTFGSTDGLAALPDDYAYQPTDGGSASFTVTLNTTDTITLSVADSLDGTLVGSVTIAVN